MKGILNHEEHEVHEDTALGRLCPAVNMQIAPRLIIAYTRCTYHYESKARDKG